jgi:hypothetical protein
MIMWAARTYSHGFGGISMEVPGDHRAGGRFRCVLTRPPGRNDVVIVVRWIQKIQEERGNRSVTHPANGYRGSAIAFAPCLLVSKMVIKTQRKKRPQCQQGKILQRSARIMRQYLTRIKPSE